MIEFLYQAHYTATKDKIQYVYDFVKANNFERIINMKNYDRVHATKPEGIENKQA